jgi:hypothetical protein
VLEAGWCIVVVTQCQCSTHSPPHEQSLEELGVGGMLSALSSVVHWCHVIHHHCRWLPHPPCKQTLAVVVVVVLVAAIVVLSIVHWSCVIHRIMSRCLQQWWWCSSPLSSPSVGIPPTVHPTSSCSRGWMQVVCYLLHCQGIPLLVMEHWMRRRKVCTLWVSPFTGLLAPLYHL